MPLHMKMLCVIFSSPGYDQQEPINGMSDHLPLLPPPAIEYSVIVIAKRLPRKTILYSCPSLL